jgi:hypothetical protein
MSMPSLSRSSSRPRGDLEALLARMRQRLYPETIPVLASFWLKTVYAAGHDRRWWRELNGLLKEVLQDPAVTGPARESLLDIQTWAHPAAFPPPKTSAGLPARMEPLGASPARERLSIYIRRLLNQWLAAEVARLLVDENEAALTQGNGIPVLAIGKSLEQLLLRERLSPEILEALLEPELLSPRYIYPADSEVLWDVILFLLGRTGAPAPPVMPATVLGVAEGSPLPGNYGESVERALFVRGREGEQIHVPIEAADALEILKGDPVRIASVIVTMDGRWWESESLQSGEQHAVIYKPRGRLRIDYSADHAKLVVPWPDTQLRWQGAICFGEPFELFGREWHEASWETDGGHTWLHLEFSRALAAAEVQPAEGTSLRRSHPASVDMAWAALETALAASMEQRSCEPLEQLRRPEFIPLGRAIFGLAELARHGRPLRRDNFETQLRAIGFHEAELSLSYGRVPWRILPALAQARLLKIRRDAAWLSLANQVFDGLPDALHHGDRHASPPQAA